MFSFHKAYPVCVSIGFLKAVLTDILYTIAALIETKKDAARISGSTQLRTAPISSEIDLRGMEAIEAVLAAERYLDSAVMGKLKTVTIIHGKGTGALRTAIHQMLKRNKAVKSFRLGRYGEGETGVTVVELK